MGRIFWTASRKAKLIKQSKTMTVNQMARHYLQPAAEIERMIAHLTGNKNFILRTYREGKHTVIVYHAAYARGIRGQRTGENISLW